MPKRTMHSLRPRLPVEGEHLLFGFLTTEPNDTLAPVHPKAMPTILTSPDEIETWMAAPSAR